MKKVHFSNITWREGRYYVAQCLNVDVSSFGKTRREALKNLEEAVALYLEDNPARIQEVRSPALITKEFTHA